MVMSEVSPNPAPSPGQEKGLDTLMEGKPFEGSKIWAAPHENYHCLYPFSSGVLRVSVHSSWVTYANWLVTACAG